MPIFLQTSSTGVPTSACLSANAICSSVNFDFFTAQPPFHIVKIVPEIPTQNGSELWVSLIAAMDSKSYCY